MDMGLPKEITTVTKLSKFIALILFISLPFIGFYIGVSYGRFSKLELLQTYPSNNSFPQDRVAEKDYGIISDGKTPKIVKELIFQVPINWRYSRSVNPYFGNAWIFINPIRPEYLPTSFVISVDSNKFIFPFSQEYLSNISQQEILVSGIEGKLVIGTATPPTGADITCPTCYLGIYNAGDKVGVFTISKGEDYYTFSGNVSENEKEFRQIIDSFEFLVVKNNSE